MLTEKDYCDYDTCVALKELGFNQYSTLRTYAGEGGVWLGEIPNHEPDYKQGDLIALHHAYGIPRDGNEVAAPSLYEVQKWLREEKNIEVNASFDKKDDGWIAFIQRLDYPDLCGTDVFSTVYNTYESALLLSIKEAIKILKEDETIHK